MSRRFFRLHYVFNRAQVFNAYSPPIPAAFDAVIIYSLRGRKRSC